MSSAVLVAVALLGVGLVVGVAVLAFALERRRRERLAALAASRGWAFTERDDRWERAFDGPPFGIGHNRQCRNVLQGVHEGRDFVGFEFVYHTTETTTDSNGHPIRREQAHWFSVLALHLGGQVPALSVSPEGFFSRALGKLTGRDIALESEEFNRAFSVRCDDRRFASDVLHPRLMEHLLTVRDVAWRTSNGHILTIESGRHELTEIDRRLAVIDAVLDQLPDFVREQYRLPRGGPR